MKKILCQLKKHLFILQMIFFVALGCSYWSYWHFKPFTGNAFVFANTRPVSPFTEGFITDIYVKNNQFVKKATLFLPSFKLPINLKSLSWKTKSPPAAPN